MSTALRHLFVIAVMVALVWTGSSALLPLVDRTASLTAQVERRMPESGVEHPLTAVLLNFRGYDTMLEIGVLLVAVLAVWTLDPAPRARWRMVEPSSRSPVLRIALHILIPTAVMAAGYMVWVGAYRPGGAFQAGTVLGAVWVILVSAGVVRLPLARVTGVRVVLAAGFTAFLLAALGPALAGQNLLEYPRLLAGMIILAVETTLSVSIGAAIGALVAGVAARRDGTEPEGGRA